MGEAPAAPNKCFVALIRGINVGRAHRVPMEELRVLWEDCGFGEAKTVLQSGNVVFRAPTDEATLNLQPLKTSFETRFGFPLTIQVFPESQFLKVLETDPLLSYVENPSRHLISFFDDISLLGECRELANKDWGVEKCSLGANALYLWCPHGVLASPLCKKVERVLGKNVTTRNWNTLVKIRKLCPANIAENHGE